MRIAIDAMGGDDGPGTIIDGALVAARHLQIGLLLVGDRDVIERELSRHPRAGALDLQILDTPESIGMSESADTALRRKPRASIRLAAEAVRDGRRCGVFQRRSYRRISDGRARRVRPAARRRSSGAGDDHSDPTTAGRPARFRRDGRVPSAASGAVCDHGRRPTRAWRSAAARRASACCRSAKRRARGTS